MYHGSLFSAVQVVGADVVDGAPVVVGREEMVGTALGGVMEGAAVGAMVGRIHNGK